jgi:hypothetical protein
MRNTWMVAAGLSANAQECRPGVRMLKICTVNYGGTVSRGDLSLARNTAAKLLAEAGVTVEWASGRTTQNRASAGFA